MKAASNITLRLARVWDSSRLHELAYDCGYTLHNGAFVVAEMRGRVIAALPVASGPPLADGAPGTAEAVQLLESMRRDFFRPRRRWTPYVRKRTS